MAALIASRVDIPAIVFEDIDAKLIMISNNNGRQMQ
jgi:hypothetical protein